VNFTGVWRRVQAAAQARAGAVHRSQRPKMVLSDKRVLKS